MDSALLRQRNWVLFLALMLQACSHVQTAPQMAEANVAQAPPAQTETELARQQLSKLQDRVQDLEVRLAALNDKINLENGAPNSSSSSTSTSPTSKMQTETVEVPPAHGKVIPTKKAIKAHPEVVGVTKENDSSASSTEAVDRFREAKILYDTKRYSDSVLEFSEFVKNESDHPLAAAAQYYVGMSYLKQNEYKLAEEELSRGLLSYSHSSYVPDTLLALAKVSEDLKKPTKVTYYREKLLTNFPNSPQAKGLTQSHHVNEETEAPKPPDEVEAPSAKMMETAEEPSVVEKPETPKLAVPSLEDTDQ
jgi:TolA-binding protein